MGKRLLLTPSIAKLNNITIKVFVFLTLYFATVNSFVRKPRFLILPGFGNDQIDYINPLGQGDGFGFATALKSRGYEVHVAPINRLSWINILRSVTTKEFYSNNCRPEQLFQFYFDNINETIDQLNDKNQDPIILLGHSAGGWLARAMMGNGTWYNSENPTRSRISGLVTLGTPHLPPLPTAPDMTRGALRYVAESYPGAYLKNQGVFYLSVAGGAVTANPEAPRGSVSKFAANSYQQVTGIISPPFDDVTITNEDSSLDVNIITGDGVVPLSHAHLDGAEQITINNCYHSIQSNMWYGSDVIVDRWLPSVLSAYHTNHAD